MELRKDYNTIETLDDMQNPMENVWYSKYITNGLPSRERKIDTFSEWVEKQTNYASSVIEDVLTWQNQYGITVDADLLAKAQEIASREKAEGLSEQSTLYSHLKATIMLLI